MPYFVSQDEINGLVNNLYNDHKCCFNDRINFSMGIH